MDRRQLRYFAAIYEEGSLARAAERERVAVSAFSRHLGILEASLGTRLFERKPRGVKPTAAGQRLYDHARAILRAMTAAEADLRDEGREVAGDVSIGTSLFMREHLETGALATRPIVEPALNRTLYVCEMSDRPATFALETVRALCIRLSLEALADGRWEAQSRIGDAVP